MGIRVNKAMTILNIGTETVIEYLKSRPGLEPTKELNPNSKLSDQYILDNILAEIRNNQ